MRTRKAAKADGWDDTLKWYALGIREMQSRDIADPTSWRYQAAIHDYVRNNDPYRKPNDVLPSPTDQGKYWRKCQHFTWFFLPWHRMYLGHFEQMIIAAIKPLGGPSDWALPYWNYSKDNAARKLPAAFTDVSIPGEQGNNPLRVLARAEGNDGAEVGDSTDTDLGCLNEPLFEASSGNGAPGFGGPRTGFKHSVIPGEATRFGSLESTPHGTMHVAVGGWMGGFETAALDPIFWLHHCNIDRLWEVWIRRTAPNKPPRFSNPTDAAFATGLIYDFHDAQRAAVTMTPSMVMNTETSVFAYKYDDVSNPSGPAPEGVTLGFMATGIPEMLGATEGGLTLLGQAQTIQFAVEAPSAPVAEAAAPRRLILNIENITAERRARGYAVYVNLPENANPAEFPDRFAGNIPLFGIDAVENPEQPHSGDGLHYSIDITKAVRALRLGGQWDPKNIRLTFVPKRRRSGLEAATEVVPVTVGRVSLYTE